MFGIKGIPVPAGAENVAEQVGSRLVKRGHQVTIYVRPHYVPHTLKEHKGMKLVHLPSVATKNLDAITHSFFSSLAAMASDAEIIHVHSTGNSIFSLLPRLLGKKTVVQSHGLDWQRAKWGKFARLYLHLTDYSSVYFPNAVTAVSKKMTAYYQSLTRRSVVYIPNGVLQPERLPPNLIRKYGLEGNDYVLFAARLVPEKGAHYLLEAFNCLNTNKKLVIAGDGVFNDLYSKKLKSWASERIIFTGFAQGDLLSELMSNCYCYVLPSEIEGLSTGLLEALSYGSCVLVSDIEENLEVIGEAGSTFESKSVENLKLKLDSLLSNEEAVRCFRSRASDHARSHFDWERITDQFEVLYNSL